jgi:deazaflavin-dependent oxidoreductase (nitroreductase family)
MTTGIQRCTALIYGRDGGNYVEIASNGGKSYHPNWYLNLRHDPDVEVQVGAELFAARASTAKGRERARLWQQMVQIWPDYDRHQHRTSREIPVVVLERR